MKQGLYDPAFEHDACGVGFVANIRGERSHDVVHKGIAGAREPRAPRRVRLRSRDGRRRRHPDPAARRLLARRGRGARHRAARRRAATRSANVFLAQDAAQARAGRRSSSSARSRAEGQQLLGWRDVPHRPDAIGRVARAAMPRIRQVFVGAAPRPRAGRLRAQALRDPARRREARSPERERLLLRPSLSTPHDRLQGHADGDADRAASTRTSRDPRSSRRSRSCTRATARTRSPTWKLAHPFRYLAHNGEINTLRGNRTGCTRARARCARALFGDDLEEALPDRARRGERLRAVRQRARVPRALGPRAARSDADDDPGGLGEPCRTWTTTGAPSTSTTRS